MYPPPQEPADPGKLPEANCPFTMDYKGAFWNCQAFLAAKEDNAAAKQRVAWGLLSNSDFIGLAETHSTKGHVRALTN